jgi:ribose transport system permease protein
VLIALLVVAACGLINGLIVARLKVLPFIATMATGYIYNGIALVLAGTGYTDFPSTTFKMLGQERFLGLQLPVYYMLFFIVIFSVLVARSRSFRRMFYIGGNPKAAEYSGIPISRVRLKTYSLASLLVGFGGIVSTMRFNAAMTSLGSGVEMRAITAAVIGGVSFTGGSGSIYGAAIGAMFVSFLNNVLPQGICVDGGRALLAYAGFRQGRRRNETLPHG